MGADFALVDVRFVVLVLKLDGVLDGDDVAGAPLVAREVPAAPAKPPAEPISADALTARIDRFLASRGVAGPSSSSPPVPTAAAPADPEKFVCEDDVRQALREGRKLLIGERTIVTPAARDAGESAKIFLYAGWLP